MLVIMCLVNIIGLLRNAANMFWLSLKLRDIIDCQSVQGDKLLLVQSTQFKEKCCPKATKLLFPDPIGQPHHVVKPPDTSNRIKITRIPVNRSFLKLNRMYPMLPTSRMTKVRKNSGRTYEQSKAPTVDKLKRVPVL